MKVVCIGGGITGQLVQLVVPSTQLLDWRAMSQGHLPQTRRYGANYLWKPIPLLPYTMFPVITHIDGNYATRDSVTAYKTKIGKAKDMEGNWAEQFQVQTTGYDCTFPTPRINYDCAVVSIDSFRKEVHLRNGSFIDYDILVSTIPLYVLLRMLNVTLNRSFRYDPIFIKVTDRPPDAPFPVSSVYVNYLSDPAVVPYRFTDRNGERHYESITPMGGTSARKILPGKIHPHPQAASTVMSLTKQNIFCFGRFAAWLPEELIHETYDRIVEWAYRMDHV